MDAVQLKKSPEPHPHTHSLLFNVTPNIKAGNHYASHLSKKGLKKVLFVNYPNKVWNRTTFLAEYRLVSV